MKKKKEEGKGKPAGQFIRIWGDSLKSNKKYFLHTVSLLHYRSLFFSILFVYS